MKTGGVVGQVAFAVPCHANGTRSDGSAYLFSNGTAYPLNSVSSAFGISPSPCLVRLGNGEGGGQLCGHCLRPLSANWVATA